MEINFLKRVLSLFTVYLVNNNKVHLVNIKRHVKHLGKLLKNVESAEKHQDKNHP